MYRDIIIGIIISFIILLLILIVSCGFLLRPPDYPIDQHSYQQIKPLFNTGDLLVVSYNSIHANLIRIFTRSIWSHISMIYIDPNDQKTYIIECTQYNSKIKDIIKIPIEEWLSLNCDCHIAWIKLCGPPLNPNVINNLVDNLKLRDIKFERVIAKWLKAVISSPYRPLADDKKFFYCSEFITYLYQELGIIRKELSPSSYSPKSYMSCIVPLISPYGLSPPVMFMYDCPNTH